eukprot:356995-Chlamydomonas_euryale.AAC.5
MMCIRTSVDAATRYAAAIQKGVFGTEPARSARYRRAGCSILAKHTSLAHQYASKHHNADSKPGPIWYALVHAKFLAKNSKYSAALRESMNKSHGMHETATRLLQLPKHDMYLVGPQNSPPGSSA